jgi:hypothetical protein
MKFVYSILLIFGIAPFIFGQKDYGYYGNKAIIQIESLANYPFFSNVLTNTISGGSSYKVSSGKLIPAKDRFNYGFRGTIGYAVKRNMALLFEVGQDYSNAGPENDNYIYDEFGYSQTISKHEILDVVTTSFIPKIEFATSKSLLPMGIGHQIGFGIANSKVIEKNYTYELGNYDSFSGSYTYTTKTYSTSSEDIDPINFRTLEVVRKYVLLYALNVRTPLTKSLLLNYGIRYTFNFGKPNSSLTYNNTGNEDYTASAIQTVSRHRLGSIINASIGLCYTF